jgi:hypothetical protein
MPTRITHFLHDSVVAPAVPASLGTTFATADAHVHDLQAREVAPVRSNRNFRGIVTGIHVRVTNIVTAAKVTIRLCADPNGDYTLVPDTEATLALGVTTANSGCVAYEVGIPLFQILGGPGNGELFLFAKVDAGSAVFSTSCITWQE